MYEYNEEFKETGLKETIRMMGEISDDQWVGIHPTNKYPKQSHLAYVGRIKTELTGYVHYVIYMRLKELTQ